MIEIRLFESIDNGFILRLVIWIYVTYIWDQTTPIIYVCEMKQSFSCTIQQHQIISFDGVLLFDNNMEKPTFILLLYILV